MMVWKRRSRANLFRCIAVFVQRRRADALDLARASAGFKILDASIAPSAPPAPTSVCSSSEHDDVFGAADLVHDGLDALFELSAVFGPRDHERQVQRDQSFVPEDLGHVAGDDLLRQSFDDGGLPTPLRPKGRGFLAAARQGLHDAVYLVIAADHGIQFSVLGRVW